MSKEKIKTYDLNLKLIFFILAIYTICACFSAHIIFFAPLLEKMYYQGLVMMVAGSPVGVVSGLLLVPYIIYLIALIAYKRKNVLIIYENKIEYYSLFKKKIVIEKREISDIYVSGKLVVKYNEKNNSKVLNINLMYIKCDKNEMRKSIITLKPENDIIKNIFSNILKEYNLKELTQLKEHKGAFEDCVIQLYNINELTQQEIASLLNTNTTKVSKIIRKSMELS